MNIIGVLCSILGFWTGMLIVLNKVNPYIHQKGDKKMLALGGSIVLLSVAMFLVSVLWL